MISLFDKARRVICLVWTQKNNRTVLTNMGEYDRLCVEKGQTPIAIIV